MSNENHNPEMNLAWRLIAATEMSVFLTGKAGTGKTTFLRKLRQLTPKRMVVLAPTGVAAINAEGQTIHSFFQLPLGPKVPGARRERKQAYSMKESKKELIRTLDLLVIDEISMVRCDLLDAVDEELRRYRRGDRPFGGVQLLLIGDLQQLPPIVTDSEWKLIAPYYQTAYFFGSRAFRQTRFVTIELRRVYRQQDQDFIDLLGKIRANHLDANALRRLNSRYVRGFVPPEGEDWIRLTTHNRMADEYNMQRLDALPGRVQRFHAEVSGSFPETSYPTDLDLIVKPGAQVMFVKNDPSGEHAYYNGKLAVVKSIDQEGIVVWSKEDGEFTAVPPVEWENRKFVLDPETKEIKEKVEGTFRQYPLRLAWAITVHKSQGLTFDRAVLDINDSFTHGQTYVALSRCRTLEGMVLARPLDARAVITDGSVKEFMARELSLAAKVSEQLPQLMRDYYLAQLDEALSFADLCYDLQYLIRVVDEHLYQSNREYLKLLKMTKEDVEKDLRDVAVRFTRQCHSMAEQKGEGFERDEAMLQRIRAAAAYFGQKMPALFKPVMDCCALRIQNKQVGRQYGRALSEFKASCKLKSVVFAYFADNPFTVRAYHSVKAKAWADR